MATVARRRCIGRGMFTSAYEYSATHVLLVSVCHTKECAAHGWLPNTFRFPTVRFAPRGTVNPTRRFGDEARLYLQRRMPAAYPRRGLLRPFERRLLQWLYTVAAEYVGEMMWAAEDDSVYALHHALDKADPKGARVAVVREHLHDAANQLSNYGSDLRFEVPWSNLNITNAGRLVFRDLFYFGTQHTKYGAPNAPRISYQQ